MIPVELRLGSRRFGVVSGDFLSSTYLRVRLREEISFDLAKTTISFA
jgi:hypothetical protein